MVYDPKLIIQTELFSDEQLLWAGRPKQGILFRESDFFMIPFSLLWGGFAIFLEVSVLLIPDSQLRAVSIIFPLFGIPFVLIGLHMIFGRFFLDLKKREKTFYGLTDQRAIILSGIFRKNVKSLNLKTITDISLSEKQNGYGTISFGHENQMMSMFTGSGMLGWGDSAIPKFELIENARQVYSQIREQQKN